MLSLEVKVASSGHSVQVATILKAPNGLYFQNSILKQQRLPCTHYCVISLRFGLASQLKSFGQNK